MPGAQRNPPRGGPRTSCNESRGVENLIERVPAPEHLASPYTREAARGFTLRRVEFQCRLEVGPRERRVSGDRGLL